MKRARARVTRALESAEMALNRRIYNRAVRRARHLIAVSNYSRQRFCEAFPSGSGPDDRDSAGCNRPILQ